MAITMSDATITRDKEDNLLAKKVDTGILGDGAKLKKSGVVFKKSTGSTLAGVTPLFAASVSSAIEQYVADVNAVLNELQNVEPSNAFKGAQLTSALKNFIEGVKSVASAYLTSLQEAEKEIINSVDKAYTSQDESVSSNLSSDTSTIQSDKPSA